MLYLYFSSTPNEKLLGKLVKEKVSFMILHLYIHSYHIRSAFKGLVSYLCMTCCKSLISAFVRAIAQPNLVLNIVCIRFHQSIALNVEFDHQCALWKPTCDDLEVTIVSMLC